MDWYRRVPVALHVKARWIVRREGRRLVDAIGWAFIHIGDAIHRWLNRTRYGTEYPTGRF